MPIIRSSRLYMYYYRLLCAMIGCWLSGVRCRAAGFEPRKRDVARRGREEKPTRCHRMLYYTYDTFNMFRALLCQSSGAPDYMCVATAYGVQCFVAGCRGSGAGQQALSPGRGMLRVAVEKKSQLDVTECFIKLTIHSTCFGHFYAHHQEHETICVLLRLWCAMLGCWLSGVRCRAASYASRQRDVARIRRATSQPTTKHCTPEAVITHI